MTTARQFTWHHPDKQLSDITKSGVAALVSGYDSDMPAYRGVLSDEQIWGVLAFVKSTWQQSIRERQERRNQGVKQ
ncbi:MAG: cytochrome c [Alphaproteobacteria bacterium]